MVLGLHLHVNYRSRFSGNQRLTPTKDGEQTLVFPSTASSGTLMTPLSPRLGSWSRHLSQ
ncbi:hypothetical protein M3J09_013859 [Ascochyta lentis]